MNFDFLSADGRRAPQVPALNRGTPTVGELFDFMRDAELRFETLRMRIVELAWAAGGELRTETEVDRRGDIRSPRVRDLARRR